MISKNILRLGLHNNPKKRKCFKCKVDLVGKWWITKGYKVFCKKCYK